MAFDDPYIEWGDVTITEETDTIETFDSGSVTYSSFWTAEFEGHIYNTGLVDTSTRPIISFSRTGRTADEAATKFFNAAMEQGWEVR